MATPETLISNVTDTATWVAYYRAKESKRRNPLFRDPFAELLIGDQGEKIAKSMQRTSKYTEWTVLMRTVVIDRFISTTLKEGVDTVLNLGAGLDTRPYRMDLPPHLNWVEVDYPAIITHKESALKQQKPKCNLSRIACDLSNATERRALLERVASASKKTLVLTEGVVIYLTEAQVSELSLDLLAHHQIKYWVVEYMHASVYPYLQQSARSALLKNAPFLFLPTQWKNFFLERGWHVNDIQYHGEEGARQNRWMPMPLFGRILSRIAPAKVLERTGRMTGFMLLEPK